MILIFSQSKYEYTTDLVYDWILHLGGNVLRVNGNDLLEDGALDIQISNKEKGFSFKGINIEDINVIWFRRWLDDDSLSNNDKINSFLRREALSLTQYFFSFFEEDKWYNNHDYYKSYPSKAEQLILALKSGFNIPETLITTSKESINSFAQKNGNLITKPLDEIEIIPNKKNKSLEGTYTTRITKEYIKDNISEYFFPSLFQKEIKKKFELRVFYNKKRIYSMAIFSNSNEQTEVDFRQYDHIKPNRNIPFKLNNKEEEMVICFMEMAGLETGSLDLIYTENNNLVFLEVNPLGQFGMVSLPCNYYLEKKIAQDLINIDNEKK